jgi:hypothetical protein
MPMKAVILAGEVEARLSEETHLLPKPILSHIMKFYSLQRTGFWQMDTLRDKNKLEELWKSGQAPWRIWE